MIDVDHQISAVERRMGSRVLAAGEARVQTISQVYRAARDDVWDACTDADRLARWFLPVTGDLHLGGRYQTKDNAEGTVERCEPPHSFAVTWEYGGEVSWVTVTLTEEAPERTRFTLEHVAHIDDERWLQFGPGATGLGWDLSLAALGGHLAGGGGDPQALEAWSATAEGRRFFTAAGDAWYTAAVAAGDDPDEARAAADRSIGFYTGAEAS